MLAYQANEAEDKTESEYKMSDVWMREVELQGARGGIGSVQGCSKQNDYWNDRAVKFIQISHLQLIRLKNPRIISAD